MTALRHLAAAIVAGAVIWAASVQLNAFRDFQMAEVAVYVAGRPWRFVFHRLPLHASWLSFIEAWFAIISKKCLARSELADFPAAARTILAFVETDNIHHARPFTGKKGIRFYHRLKDKLAAAASAAAVPAAA